MNALLLLSLILILTATFLFYNQEDTQVKCKASRNCNSDGTCCKSTTTNEVVEDAVVEEVVEESAAPIYIKLDFERLADNSGCTKKQVKQFLNQDENLAPEIVQLLDIGLKSTVAGNPQIIWKKTTNKDLAAKLGVSLNSVNSYFNPERECKKETELTELFSQIIDDTGNIPTL